MIEFTLYTALIACIIGFGIQIYRLKKNEDLLNFEKSSQPGLIIKDFFFNTFLQTKLFRAGKIRWGIHFGLFLSFLYLLTVHGLHGVTANFLFSEYEPTLDPFQFLRNFTGFFVLAGCVAFLVRRRINIKVNIDQTIKIKGLFTVILILLIIGSGFLLEASKIISEPIFTEMVEEYADIDDEELIDLKRYWKYNYSVFFEENLQSTPEQLEPEQLEPEQLENGEILNEEYCLYCHSNIRSAFLSRAVAKTIYSAGQRFNTNRLDLKLYWIHYGLCLILLISLPFSRISHVLLIPFASSRRKLTALDYQSNRVSINVATLHACTNCGFCSQVCSVYPNFQITRNPDILPHRKIETVKQFLNHPSSIDLLQLNTGNDACTLCHKCTDICPSGIDLQTLWKVLNKKLVQMDVKDNRRLISEMPLTQWMSKEFLEKPDIAPNWVPAETASMDHLTSNLADRIESFENCIQCTICSNVCPIVDYDSNNIDMSPHQIMNLLRLGKKHLATGTRMVWTCLTCYACQENCPQDIQVTDILLELRNAGSVKAAMIQKNKVNKRLTNK